MGDVSGGKPSLPIFASVIVTNGEETNGATKERRSKWASKEGHSKSNKEK